MARYTDTVRDANGTPIAGVSIYVYDQDEALAELTADEGGELGNPVTSDSYGVFAFNADDGLYTLEFRYGGRLIFREVAVVVDGAIPDNSSPAAVSAAISAGLAQDAAEAAQDAVGDAEAARDQAGLYASAAAIAPGRIYDTVADGVAAVPAGEYFYHEDGSGNLPLFRDVAGVGTAQAFVMPGVATVNAAATAHQRFTSPFRQAVADTYLRNVVEDIYVEGGPAGHDYVLNIETLSLGAGNGRVTFKLRNATLGIDVAQWQKLDTQANLNARTSPTVFGYQGALVGYRGVTFTAWINWSVITWATALTTYTTVAQAGIRTDRTLNWDRIGVFKERAEPKVRHTIGAGTETATHINSFADAIAARYIPGVTITRSTFPPTDDCSFSNQYLFECIDDGYVEDIVATTIGGIDQSTVLGLPYMTLRGRGDTRLRMNAGAGNTAPVMELPFPFRIERMVIESQGEGYAAHIDNNNFLAKRATVGPAILAYRMISVFYECTLIGSADQLTWLIGCGISNGHTIRLERCRIIGAAGLPFLGVHTSDSPTDAGEIEIIDCYFNDELITDASAMQLIKIDAMTLQHNVLIRNTDMAGFTVGNTVDATPGFIRRGKIDPAIFIDPPGSLDT